MSLKVIELNDAAVRVGDESGIIIQSPGFALAKDKKLQLGEEAEQQARLQPTSSYNKFWHELSLDPLSHGNGVRHFADLAYAHLLHLAEQANIEGDVIFAVPGNFTRQQLAVLLGLAKQCPFTPVGVVDSALAAAVSEAGEQPIVYADIQLHQVVVSRLLPADQHLKVDSVIQVPGVGSQNFMDLMMALATKSFIQQCRFNPQHNAESEQQLYNALPHWWRSNEQSESSLILELKANHTVHTAKMPRESLVTNLSSHYQKIHQNIAALVSNSDAKVLISAGLAALPGLTSALGTGFDIKIIAADCPSKACLNYREHICVAAEGMRLINTLPVKSVSEQSTAPKVRPTTSANERPTHILYRNRAMELGDLEIRNYPQLNGYTPVEKTIQLAISGLPELAGKISVHDNNVFLDTGNLEIILNQKKVSGKQKLALGDCIRFAEDSDSISLIQVSDSN